MGVRELRVVVAAEEYDVAVGFYRDVLGMREQAAFPGPAGAEVTILDAGRATFEIANPAQREYIDEVEVGRAVAPRIRVAFEVDDVPGVTAALVAAGAPRSRAPRPTPFGSVNARLEAPAGLQITVFQPTGGGPVDARLDVPGGDSAARGRMRPAGCRDRDAVAEDWSAIWPFFRQIVAAGETYAWPRDMSRGRRPRGLVPGPGRTVVASGRRQGGRQRQDAAEPAGTRARTSPTRASWSTRRTAGAASGAPSASTCWPRPRADGYRAMQFNAVVATNTGAVALWARSASPSSARSRRVRPPHARPGPILIMHRRL